MDHLNDPVADTQWGNKTYRNMRHLETVLEDDSLHSPRDCKLLGLR